MLSDLHFRLAEGEGLEPPSPFGQRFSSPSTSASTATTEFPASTWQKPQRTRSDERFSHL